MRVFLGLSWARDVLGLLSASVAVSSTVAVSAVEEALSFLLAGRRHSDLGRYLAGDHLQIFYFLVLAFFWLCSAVLLVYYGLRAAWELLLLRDRHAEKSECADCCFVRGLRLALYATFFTLFALFVLYWIFWGNVLRTAYGRVLYFLELMELSHFNPDPDMGPATASPTRKIRDGLALLPSFFVVWIANILTLSSFCTRLLATIAAFVLIVFYLLSVSFNILIVLRTIFNKLSLLGTNMRGEVNRVSLFRVRAVDLTLVGKHLYVFRQLWVSFFFDCIELCTIAVWVAYPVYVVLLWSAEKTCFESLSLEDSDVSPLLNCVMQGRYYLLAVGVIMILIVFVLLVLYFLRALEERSLLVNKIHNPGACKMSNLYAFLVLLVPLFLMSAFGAVVSMFMLAKPFYSTLAEEKQIQLALPGVVFLAGSIFAMLYLGKKITFAVAIRVNPRLSFFFEGAMNLTTEQNVNNLKGNGEDDDVVELNLYSPIFDDDTILY